MNASRKIRCILSVITNQGIKSQLFGQASGGYARESPYQRELYRHPGLVPELAVGYRWIAIFDWLPPGWIFSQNVDSLGPFIVSSRAHGKPILPSNNPFPQPHKSDEPLHCCCSTIMIAPSLMLMMCQSDSTPRMTSSTRASLNSLQIFDSWNRSSFNS